MRSYLFAATALATGIFIGSHIELNTPNFTSASIVLQSGVEPSVSDEHTKVWEAAISELAPAQSLRPQARPTVNTEVMTEASGIVLAPVEMVNHSAIRNLPITETLEEMISSATGAVYGPGYTVQVYSGGQHGHETAARLGVRRVGTRAHDHGHAADIYVVDPRGRRVNGNALAPLAQYWLASGHGGVGLEMKGGGIHLDEGRVRFWDYANDGGSITKVQLDALVAGKRGVMPKLHPAASSDLDLAPGLPGRIQGLQNHIQRFESWGAVKSQGVQSTYQVVYGGIAAADRPLVALTSMTVAEVLAWQDSIDSRYPSEAAGAYQVMEDTLRGLADSGHIYPETVFNKATQDTVAELLIERRGLSKFIAGKLSAEDFADNLAREWSSFPVVRDQKGASRNVERGQSYYAGEGVNRAHADPDEFLNVIKGVLMKPAESPEDTKAALGKTGEVRTEGLDVAH